MAKFGKFSEASVEAGTKAGTGKGNPSMHKSSGIVDEKAAHGQTIKRAFGLDTSDMELANERGDSMGGSPTNLAHSLKGSSAVQDNGPGGKQSPYVKNH